MIWPFRKPKPINPGYELAMIPVRKRKQAIRDQVDRMRRDLGKPAWQWKPL